jgi:WD40 repeat protein/transcriptional regulator with XRE-family HTH domain
MPAPVTPGLGDLERLGTREDFGHELGRLKDATGLSVREMARLTGAVDGHPISRATLSDYFTGKHLPQTLADLRKLLGACGVRDPEVTVAWEEAWRRVRISPGPRPNSDPVPYRGLEFFRCEDAAWFFGRSELTDLAVRRAAETRAARRPMLIVGPSGAGKSSLLRAGLLPALAETGNGTAPGADIPVWTPGTDPRGVLSRCLNSEPVVIDQLEEIFAPTIAEQTRQEFIAAIFRTAAGGTAVILGMRADFYAQALRYPELADAMQDGQVVVGPMTEAELRQAITEPARLAKARVDDELVELLISELRGPACRLVPEAGTLPMLSYALLATWERRQAGRLTVDGYRAIGGIGGAVRTAAEAAYASLDDAGARAARRLFLRLVWVVDDAPDTRRRARIAELVPDPDDRAALDAFVTHRLLTASGKAGEPDGTVEITHEVLLTAWPRLREWIDTSRTDLLIRRRVTEEAREWEAHGRRTSDLLRGRKLALARPLATDPVKRADLTTPERDLLDASISADEARQRDEEAQRQSERRTARRMRRLTSALTAALVLAGGLTAYAFGQRATANTQRDLATSRQIASEAEQLRGQDPGLAAQLGVAAYRAAATPQARASLLESTGTATPERLAGPGGTVQSVAVSSDHRLLAAVDSDGDVWLWRCSPDGTPVRPGHRIARFGAPLFATAFSPGGTTLAVAGADGTVHLFAVTDPAHPRTLTGPQNTVYSLAFAPDGTTLAAGSADGDVWLWNMPGPHPKGVGLAAGDGYVQTVAFSPSGRVLAAGTSGGTIRLWSVANPGPKALGRPLAGPSNAVYSVAFSPDGSTLAAGSRDTHVYLWDTANAAHPRPEGTLNGATSWVNAVAFSTDGSTLAAGGSDDTVRLWNMTSRKVTATLAHPDPVTTLAWEGGTREGGTLVTGGADATVRLWKVPPPVLAAGGIVNGVAYSPDGRLLAVASSDLRLWDPATDTPLGTAQTDPKGVPEAVAFDPRRQLVATGDSDGVVLLYKYSDDGGLAPYGETLRAAASGEVETVKFSPDGRLLATGGDDGTLRLWDVSAAPRLVAVVHVGGTLVLSVAFAPDGGYVATGDAGDKVRIWSLADPARPAAVATLTGPANYVYTVAFSPDGRLLAAGSADQSVYLWNISAIRHPVRYGPPLTGPASYVYAIAFSADGRFLAAGGTDDTVWLWSLSDGTPALDATLTGPTGPVYTVGFSHSGQVLAAGSADGTVRLWDTNPAAAEAAVCDTAGDPITRREWDRYVPGAPYAAPCG